MKVKCLATLLPASRFPSAPPIPLPREPSAEPPGARLHFPPTAAGDQSYTLLKLYDLSAHLAGAVLSGLQTREVDFPFRRVAALRCAVTLCMPC